MQTGTVKWFDSKKGFGFILNEDGKDVFAHFTVIEGEGFRALKEGEVVSYDLVAGENGLRASKIVRPSQKRRGKTLQHLSPTPVQAA